MENMQALMTFHEMNYEEQLHITLHRDHFRNAELTPLKQQVNRTFSKATHSAQQALCRYEVFQNTPVCRAAGGA